LAPRGWSVIMLPSTGLIQRPLALCDAAQPCHCIKIFRRHRRQHDLAIVLELLRRTLECVAILLHRHENDLDGVAETSAEMSLAAC